MTQEKSTDLLSFSHEENPPLRFARQAMNTTFEIFIYHDNKEYAEQAASAAFDEIDRLEMELSRFKESSDISQINALQQNETITLGADCYQCMQHCMQLYNQTKGAFDISAGFLIDLWKNAPIKKMGPDPQEIEKRMQYSGLSWLHLLDNYRVRLMAPRIKLDLGGYGKGYAIESAANLLQEWEIHNGLINAGMSSMMPLNTSAWSVTVRHPQNVSEIVLNIQLSARTISGSGIKKGQHIIDPRNGYPVVGKIAAWAASDNPGASDALSTAFMIMSVAEIEKYCFEYNTSAVIITSEGKTIQIGEF